VTTPNKSDLFLHGVTYDVIYDDPANSGSNQYGLGAGNTYDRADFLTIDSTRTPNYRSLKKHQLPFHNYSKSKNQWTDPGVPMSQRYHDHGPGYNLDRLYNFHGANVLFNGVDVGNGGYVLDEREGELANKIRGKLNQKKTDLGVTMAEFGKTADMVSKTANRLYWAVKAVRSGNLPLFAEVLGFDYGLRQSKRWRKQQSMSKFGTAAGTERFAAQMWLEYSYGWKPLLNDVYTTAEAFAETMIERQNLVRWVHAEVRNSHTVSETFDVRNWTARKVWTMEVQRKMKIAYKIDPGGVNALNVFGLTNPLTIAWELVPFSFVADWFLPIGQALGDLTATCDLTWAGGFVNRKYKFTTSTRYGPGKPWYPSGVAGVGPWWTAEGGQMEFKQEEFVFSRTGMSGFPGPAFPKFKNPMSASHATSAIALLSSLWRK